MSGTDQLREQLAAMQSSLQAFSAPVVDEHAGLRLMAETLREREAHIQQQIEKNETCTITLVLRDVAQHGATPAELVAALITGVAAAVTAAAEAEIATWEHAVPAATAVEAATLHLRGLEIDGEVSVILVRPPGPLEAQLAHPASDATFAEYVMAQVTDAVEAAVRGGDSVPAHLADPLGSIAELVVTAGTVLEWSLDPFVLAARSVTVDQTAAQRLLERATG